MKDGNCSLYLYVAGENFDSDAFSKSLGPSLKGSIGSRTNRLKGVVEKYWKSKETEIADSEFVGDALFDLLETYKSSLLSLRPLDDKDIGANIVVHNSDLYSQRGYSFSKELLGLLVEVGAEVDIDVYGPDEE